MLKKFNKALSVLLIIAVLLGVFSPSTPYLSEMLRYRDVKTAQLQTFSAESNEEIFVVLYNENGEIIQSNTSQQSVEYGEYLVNLVGFVPNSPISYGADVYVNVGEDCTTTLVTGYTNALGYYSYTYDANGNIIGEWFVATDGQTRATDYTYDQNGQLTQTQVVYNGGQENSDSRLYVYEYSNGNITSNTMYYPGGYNQTNLSYDNTANWKDQATVINGENITYDTVGNPLVYRGATLTWENGRQLKSYTKDGQTISFGYDAEGKRTRKTLPNGVYYEYIYSDGVLTSVKSSDFGVNFTYITDESGNYIGFKNYNTMYYFVRNLQNDVVAITDSNGNVIVRYEYDPWGVPTIIADGENYSIGYANMIRYRGYFYDVETELYYLQSRYYDPSTGRFINADTTDILSVGSTIYDKNLYSYCDNNPITRVDVSGYIWETVFDVASLCLSIVDVANNPKDIWAWVGLVADVVDLVPFLTGVGETTKVLTAANRASNYADAVADSVKYLDQPIKTGWSKGDNIFNLTKAGNDPSWPTVRRRYWMNESLNPLSEYASQAERMGRGLAPLGDDNLPVNLHHPRGRENFNKWLFTPMTTEQHIKWHQKWGYKR